MNTSQFAITEDGKVYQFAPRREPVFLGHIAYILHDQTLISQEVATWWRKRLASNEPAENYVLPKRSRAKQTPLPPAHLSEMIAVVGSHPSREAAEEAFEEALANY